MMRSAGAGAGADAGRRAGPLDEDRKSTRLNSSHSQISYAVFCLKKKKKHHLLSYTASECCCLGFLVDRVWPLDNYVAELGARARADDRCPGGRWLLARDESTCST